MSSSIFCIIEALGMAEDHVNVMEVEKREGLDFTKKKLHVMNKDICNIEDATYIDEVKDHIGTSVGKVEGFREERFNKANEDMKKMQEAI